ncbi:hypothetical protein BASA81_003086 [Batrachochytrium salamandrivorans]|nr:hypothetical protein BASA81_003086 [Batrachochytrium salamandrivorans]
MDFQALLDIDEATDFPESKKRNSNDSDSSEEEKRSKPNNPQDDKDEEENYDDNLVSCRDTTGVTDSRAEDEVVENSSQEEDSFVLD